MLTWFNIKMQQAPFLFYLLFFLLKYFILCGGSHRNACSISECKNTTGHQREKHSSPGTYCSWTYRYSFSSPTVSSRSALWKSTSLRWSSHVFKIGATHFSIAFWPVGIKQYFLSQGVLIIQGW